jgi:hypothetical protein
MRLQAEQYQFNAPDGTPAQVVSNTATEVTYYVDSGPYKGYYIHDKETGHNHIKQA